VVVLKQILGPDLDIESVEVQRHLIVTQIHLTY
jgi:uncharacterized metal-binding protein